jgi:glycosyltransferase involved in cell wall biosynthesis
MKNKTSIVSIGMPLYNEEHFLAQALDSLLSQDFQDFELIILNNGSTDSTEEICLNYQEKDKRIRYCRNETNLGAVQSFNRTFLMSSGKYFMWAAGHDLWHRSYISRCLDVIENDPNVALCYTQVGVIDADNKLIEKVEEGIDTCGLDTFDRFRTTLWGLVRIPYSDPIYGLIRSEALRRSGLLRNLWGTDNMILLELSFSGSVAQIKECLYYRRLNRDRAADVEHWTDRYLEALDPRNRKKRIKLTYSHMCYGYMKVVRHHSQFTNVQKLILISDIWRSVLGKFWRGFLFHDVVCGMIRLLFGDRGAYIFKKYSYHLAKSIGMYK